MASYVIAGASRGLGYAFVKQLSANPDNTVIGLARSKGPAEAKFAADFPDRKNTTFLTGDLDKRDTLEAAAKEVSRITGGAVDVLIVNAAIGPGASVPISIEATRDPSTFEKDMLACFRTNVIGSVHVMAFFAPLVLAGRLKKAVAISSGMGDADWVADWGVYMQSPYAISKAALNMAVAKFHAEYRDRGVVYMAISPGLVDTDFGRNIEKTPEAEAVLADMYRIVKEYCPEFERPFTPEESAKEVLGVVHRATVEANGGKMVSHRNTRKWV